MIETLKERNERLEERLLEWAVFSWVVFFLIFAWLSHAKILPGSALTHFGVGFSCFIAGLGCFAILQGFEGKNKLCDILLSIYGYLLIMNWIVYFILRFTDKIGPANDLGAAFLAIFYTLLAITGYFLSGLHYKLDSYL